jgi:hypothetical protein
MAHLSTISLIPDRLWLLELNDLEDFWSHARRIFHVDEKISA